MRRLTNLLLLASVAVLVSTGLIAWVLPETTATPLYTLHRIAGVGLLLALPWKELIARASLRRRLRESRLATALPGVAASAALAVTLVLGLSWTLGLISFDRPIPYSLLNVHVFAGIALVPIVLWHLVRRWEPPRPQDLASRRGALRILGVSALAILFGSLLERFPAGRRITGSKHAGSFTGNDFPLTIWAFDQVPAVDPARWRLQIAGAVRSPGSVAYADLLADPRELDAILDCTGGWWSEQRWRGADVLDLIRSRGLDERVTKATITSVTGHAWTFPLEELRGALVATHVGGERLTAGHGFPARLVVPGRRGFQWVKWVARIEVS